MMGSLVLGLVGILFITVGLVFLFNIQIPWRALVGLVTLAIELLFIIVAFNLIRLTK